MGADDPTSTIEVTVVGSANLDLVVEVETIPLVGETVLGGDLRRVPGGKGANQAVAAARLGRRVMMIGRLGDDEGGAILRSALDADGVDTSQLRSTPGVPNGVALIAVGGDGDNAIVVSPGANARVTGADVDAAGAALDATVTLLQLEIPLDAVAAAAQRATGTVILNPAPAPAAALPDHLLAAVDVLVPNQTELATLAGYDGSVDLEIATELAAQLPSRAVVVTLGAEGALVVADGVTTHVPAPVVTPVDTTAAGDSFCGALADAIVRGADLVDAARWAVRVGAATTQRPGAQPSLPTPAEVDAFVGGA
ncbi:MAG: ribokinase [Actinomycetota bacterium]